MMINNRTLIRFLIVLLILVLANCSNEGDGKDTIYVCDELTDHWISGSGTISADLNGSYSLSAFDEDFYTAFGNYIKTITEADLDTAIGSMTISPGFVDLSYSYAGSVHLTRRWYLIYSDQTYTYIKGSVSWADSTSGILVLDGVPSAFTASGDTLSITYPIWCFLLEEAPVP